MGFVENYVLNLDRKKKSNLIKLTAAIEIDGDDYYECCQATMNEKNHYPCWCCSPCFLLNLQEI